MSDVMDGSESVSGTRDGTLLALAVARAMGAACSSLAVDFQHIITMTNSAACAFWARVFRDKGGQAASTVCFINVNPIVLRSLEYGLEQAQHLADEKRQERMA